MNACTTYGMHGRKTFLATYVFQQVITTEIRFFAGCHEHSARAEKYRGKASPSVALGIHPSGKDMLAEFSFFLGH